MKKVFLTALSAVIALNMAGCQNIDTPKLETTQDSMSWAMGETLAKSFLQNNGINLNKELVMKAVESTLDGKTSLMDPQTVQDMAEYMNYMMTQYRKQETAKLEKAAEEAEAKLFEKLLKENPNVKQAEEGYYYEVLQEGKGPKATYAQRVEFDYISYRMPDGQIHDQTVGQREPIITVIGQHIFPGLRFALQKMNAGSKYRFYFPNRLAFGAQSSEDLPAYTPMIYEIEMHKLYND